MSLSPPGKSFRFTWGPPNLRRALQFRDPKYVTRAPRKLRRAPPIRPEIRDALQTPGVECRILRRYNAVQKTFDSWYILDEPVTATVTVGKSTDEGVTARYDAKSSQQCAQLCIPRQKVPEADRTTRIIMVAEVLPDGATEYELKVATDFPQAAFDAMQRGEEVLNHVLLRISHLYAQKGPRCKEIRALWKAVAGAAPVCLKII